MKSSYRKLRIHQLAVALKAFDRARNSNRPSRGWLRSIREATGLSLEEVGRISRNTRQDILAFEKAEASDRITLASLRKVANALGCELVYAIVPKEGTLQQLSERPAREEAKRRVLAVEHTMALEGQGTGRVKEKIEEETRRILKKRR
jgi:predicted DNA-binding mobile mystery protein A